MTTESANDFIRVRDAANNLGETFDECDRNYEACLVHALSTTLPEEHLAALEELERFRTALQSVKRNLELVGGEMVRHSATWGIVNEALNFDESSTDVK